MMLEDVPKPTTRDMLAREMATWKTVDLRVRREFQPLPGRTDRTNDGPITDRLHFLEAAGLQRLQTRSGSAEYPGAIFVSTKIRRGLSLDSAFQIEEPGRTSRPSVSLNSHSSPDKDFGDGVFDRPEPLCLYYFEGRPLHESISTNYCIGTARVLERVCDGFRLTSRRKNVTNADPLRYEYWLDRETGTPLRFDYLYPVERGAYRPHYTWTAETLDVVSGRHIPLRSTVISYDSVQEGPPASRLDRRLIVEEIQFDREIDESTFQLDLMADAYLVETQPFATVDSPIRASYPSAYPSPASAGCLAVGGLLLTVVVLGWAIRRLASWKKPSQKTKARVGLD